jgi:hypothetical protein
MTGGGGTGKRTKLREVQCVLDTSVSISSTCRGDMCHWQVRWCERGTENPTQQDAQRKKWGARHEPFKKHKGDVARGNRRKGVTRGVTWGRTGDYDVWYVRVVHVVRRGGGRDRKRVRYGGAPRRVLNCKRRGARNQRPAIRDPYVIERSNEGSGSTVRGRRGGGVARRRSPYGSKVKRTRAATGSSTAPNSDYQIFFMSWICLEPYRSRRGGRGTAQQLTISHTCVWQAQAVRSPRGV